MSNDMIGIDPHRDDYDPDLQDGVDWHLIPIIIVPFLILCAIVVALTQLL